MLVREALNIDDHRFAKVRVAGSNPVFRSRYNRRSGTLSRVSDCFPGDGRPYNLPIRDMCADQRKWFRRSNWLEKVMLYHRELGWGLEGGKPNVRISELLCALT